MVMRMSKTHVPTVVTSAKKAALLRQEIRDAIPVSAYVALLHDAVVTGRIRDTDRHGNPIGTTTEVPIKDRLSIAQYLINKVLPDKAEPVMNLTRADVLSMSPEQLRALPADLVLEALRLAAISDTPDTESPCPPGSSTSSDSQPPSSSSASESSP